MDEILASLEEDIELLGDSVEERKAKTDIAKLLELLQDDCSLLCQINEVDVANRSRDALKSVPWLRERHK